MSSPPPRRRRRQSPFRVVAALFLALLAHAVFVGILLLTSEPRPIRAQEPKAVALRAISSSEWDRTREVRPPTDSSRRPPREPKEPEPPPEENGLHVSTAPSKDRTKAPTNNQRPDDAKLFAEHNNAVEKESLSRDRFDTYENLQPRRTTNEKPVALGDADRQQLEAPLPKIGAESAEDQGIGKAARVELPSVEKRTEIALRPSDRPIDGAGPVVGNREASAPIVGNGERLILAPGAGIAQGAVEGGPGDRPHLKLLPSAAALDEIIGGPMSGGVEGVDEGDVTALNTIVSPFAGYLTRIQGTFNAHYMGVVREKLQVRDPTLSTYLYKDRRTTVDVMFDPDGKIVGITVSESSGVDFLDRAVVETFKNMEVVPNMPRPLAQRGGLFLRFDFTLLNPHSPILRFDRGY